MQVVLQAAETLENAGAVENFPSVADGLWRLIYSSALSAGSGSGGGASSQVLSYIYMNVYIHVGMGTDVYVYINVYIHVYIYIYAYMRVSRCHFCKHQIAGLSAPLDLGRR